MPEGSARNPGPGTVYLDRYKTSAPTPPTLTPQDPERLQEMREGVQKDRELLAGKGGRELTSTALDFVPGIGDVKSAQEAISGKNLVTGESLGWLDRILTAPGALPLVPPLAGIFKGAKGLVKGSKEFSVFEKAQELEKAGVDMEKIRQQTGWFRAPWGEGEKGAKEAGDLGKWRFEIDDSALKVNTDAELKMTLGGGKDVSLGELIDHPLLFKDYPFMKDVTVRRVSKGGSQWDASKNRITLGPGAEKDTLIHEIQHAIQEHEGFARGGSPRNIRKSEVDLDTWLYYPHEAYKRLAGEYEARKASERMGKTSPERAAQAPYATGEQIDPRELIVRTTNGINSRVHPAPPTRYNRK